MPTTDSNLTGTFIANTYQKLLQVDSQYGSIGTTAPFVTIDARTTTKYNLLNGLGQSVPYVVIDHTAAPDGSVFLKNTGKDPNSLWGIQIENSGDNYGSSGLNFWRPSGSDESSGNNYLFLKNTGTTWVGFQSQNIFNDIIESSTSPLIQGYRGTYTLYVSDGILVKGVSRKVDNISNPTPSLAVGAPTSGGVGFAGTFQRLKLGNDMTDGSNSELSIMSRVSSLSIYGSASNTITAVDNNFNFWMREYNGSLGNQFHPFKIIRYSFYWPDNIVSFKNLVDTDGSTPMSSSDWAAMVVGFNYDNDNDQAVNNFIVACYRDSGIWKLRVGNDGGSGTPNQIWNVDVLFIRKGWYDDTARAGFGQPFVDIQI